MRLEGIKCKMKNNLFTERETKWLHQQMLLVSSAPKKFIVNVEGNG
jgi:hypothetical protein